MCSRCYCILLLCCIAAISSFLPAPSQAQNADPSDAWLGRWSAEEDYFRPVIRLERREEGGLTAYLGSSSERGAPFSDLTVRGDSIFLEYARANARFEGALSEEGPEITGTWEQGERTASLTLTPVGESSSEDASAGPPRPQEPEPPYPYDTEDVRFRNASDDVALAGTLTRPEGEGPHPAVVLLSGTGPQNRNAEAHRHKPFHVLADYLTRQGIAVLRYDKRGVAQSEGHYMGASFEELAGDAAAALRFLKEQPHIAEDEVGLIGLSEGGYLAPMVSERFESASFMVLLAAPSVPGIQLLRGQADRALALPPDAPKAARDSARRVNRRVMNAIHAAPDSAAVASKVRSILTEEGVSGEKLRTLVRQASAPGAQDFARYDPQPALQQVEVPVLALYGGKDLQVPPAQNVDPMRSALGESASDDATVHVVEGINHALQPAKTGHPNEYHSIDTTVAPKVLRTITGWIQAHTSLSQAR